MGFTKLSAPRIRWVRFGNDQALDWTVVKGVKIIYESVAGSTGSVRFDDLFVTAGADGRALTGTFRARMKFVFNDEQFTDESLPSPVSDLVGLNAEALQLVIPQQTAIAMDPQTTEVWPYIWSASMGGYYRCLNPIGMNRAKKTVNEWGAFLPDGIISADDRLRILTVGRCVGRRYLPGTDPIYTVASSTSTAPVPVVAVVAAVSIVYASGVAPSGTVAPMTLVWTTRAAGVVSIFSFPTLPSGISITSVMLTMTLDATDIFGTNPDVFCYHVALIGGVIYRSVLFSFQAGIGTSSSTTWTVNPATGIAWTDDERNAAAFGIEFVANAYTDDFRATLATITDSYTIPGGSASTVVAKNVLTFHIQTSEAELLLRNDVLKSGRQSVPDNIVAIVGNHYGRTLALTQDYLFFSDPGHPGIYPVLQAVKIADGVNEQNQWMHKASGSIYIGTNKDIYRIDGDLTERPDGTLNASVKALNLGSPPINPAIAYEGNALAYMATDGPRVLLGEVSTPLQGDLALLLRGIERHGIPAISTAGRHRLAMADGFLYWIIPTTDAVSRRVTVGEFLPPPNGTWTASKRRRVLTVGRGGAFTGAILRYAFDTQKWSYRVYSRTFSSITRTLAGDVIAGTTSGDVIQLDTGTTDDDQPISVALRTAEMDNGQPNQRKVPWDLAMRMDTGGATVTVGVYLDGSDTAATSFQASTDGEEVFTTSIAALSKFRRIQLRVDGYAPRFRLWDWNISYRDMPQHHYHVDTGNVTTGKEYLRWFREITILGQTAHDLEVDVYFDDVLATTETLTAVPGKVHTYRIPLERGVKGKFPRVVIRTTADASAGEDGFEVYWVQWKMWRSGNETQHPILKWSMTQK